jgi:tRNA G18 (ribose-2'-O)-methylase SpoU
MMRGYFGIGIYNGKCAENVGTLWRSAYQLGAAFTFTIGRRYPKQASDTLKAHRHIPHYDYLTWEDFNDHRPKGCPVVAVEMGGLPILTFRHPERVIYLLGAEDHGIPPSLLTLCQEHISIPSLRTESFNVAVAGSIVMYDRMTKEA